jgi:hypothetical protein
MPTSAFFAATLTAERRIADENIFEGQIWSSGFFRLSPARSTLISTEEFDPSRSRSTELELQNSEHVSCQSFSLNQPQSVSSPETWVTDRTGDMGDNLVPIGLSMGCKAPGSI